MCWGFSKNKRAAQLQGKPKKKVTKYALLFFLRNLYWRETNQHRILCALKSLMQWIHSYETLTQTHCSNLGFQSSVALLSLWVQLNRLLVQSQWKATSPLHMLPMAGSDRVKAQHVPARLSACRPTLSSPSPAGRRRRHAILKSQSWSPESEKLKGWR